MTEKTTHNYDLLMPNYPVPPIHVVSGQGSWLETDKGQKILDGLSGIAVNVLGHGHKAVVEAISEQAARLAHTSNLIGTNPVLELAQNLRDITGWDDAKSFFCNSGTEANEAALKLAHRHGVDKNPQKIQVISIKGGFHGRTLGSLRVTSKSAKTETFEPLGEWNTQVSNIEELRGAFNEQICAIILEVIQGENGICPLDTELIKEARNLCDKYDALLIIDEVQTGIGRTGQWFAYETVGVKPDVITLAKGLGGGMPIGAVIANGEAANAFHVGDHGSTFGGNPIACASANAVINTIKKEGLLEKVQEKGQYLKDKLERLTDNHPQIANVRGTGLLIGLVLKDDEAKAIFSKCLENGLYINAPRENVLRIAPALTITKEEIDILVQKLEDSL